MKTVEQVIEKYRSRLLDPKRFGDMYAYASERVSDAEFDRRAQELSSKWEDHEWTRDSLLDKLKDDVASGFREALARRGILAGFFIERVHMWNWILEEGLEDQGGKIWLYYGLPLFKMVAVKYGWDNPIGDHEGNEKMYIF